MNNLEIEIKTLLQTAENAENLLQKLHAADPELKLADTNSQLNNYFINGDFPRLTVLIHEFLTEDEKEKFHQISHHAKNHSVRTRKQNEKIILVIKASIDTDSSSNGVARIEFEKEFKNMSLDDLDKLLLTSDFQFQAKWSRERKEYIFNPASLNINSENTSKITICIDKNAGYGYLAEFEIMVLDTLKVEESKNYLRNIMKALGVEELPQDRLERMFAFYNEHWNEYYDTEKVFDIN